MNMGGRYLVQHSKFAPLKPEMGTFRNQALA
jgi:hypothetical protein